MTAIARVLVLGVDGYRRWGSPRTGPCPHRLRHGGRSCSAFARAALDRHGGRRGLALLWRRFARCRRAAEALAADGRVAAAAAPDGGDARPPVGIGGGAGGVAPTPEAAERRNRRGRRDVLDGTLATCCALELVTSILPCNS